MVATQDTINLSQEKSLDIFDSVTHIAFSSSTTEPTVSDTTLASEVDRYEIYSTTRTTDYIDITVRVPLGKLEGTTINSYGGFDSDSGGNMYFAKVTSSVNVIL